MRASRGQPPPQSSRRTPRPSRTRLSVAPVEPSSTIPRHRLTPPNHSIVPKPVVRICHLILRSPVHPYFRNLFSKLLAFPLLLGLLIFSCPSLTFRGRARTFHESVLGRSHLHLRLPRPSGLTPPCRDAGG